MPLTPEEQRRRARAIAVATVKMTQAEADAQNAAERAPPPAAAANAIARPEALNQIKAPFCFVELSDTVVPREPASAGAIDAPIPGGFCASIEVTWAAETPLLIGMETNNVSRPMTLRDGRDYVIPGATLRGMSRAAMEIVAYGRLSQLNRHYRYGVRDFEHARYAASPVSRILDVRAGWLERHPDWTPHKNVYRITPCEWSLVRINTLPGGADERAWSRMKIGAKYAAAGVFSNGRPDFGTAATKTFRNAAPGIGHWAGKAIVAPDAAGTVKNGTYVFSDVSPAAEGKHYEYVFADPASGASAVRVSDAAYLGFFLVHSRRTRNKAVADKTWALLKPVADGGGRVPVFYVGDLAIQDPNRFAFGLTRLFKVPHGNSVGDILDRQPAHKLAPIVNNEVRFTPDFVENLFGHVIDREDLDRAGLPATARISPSDAAKKGRIAFSFARMTTAREAVEETPTVQTTLMAPRASFAPFYLRGQYKDYTDSPDEPNAKARLAGRKRYFPRYPRAAGARAQITSRLEDQRASGDTISNLRFLAPRQEGGDIRFISEIRLRNVTAAEVGAVLWILTHGGNPAKPFRHMVGRAKPFGAGQMRVVQARLALEPNDKTEAAEQAGMLGAPDVTECEGDAREGFCPAPKTGEAAKKNASHKPFLGAFKKHMTDHVQGWPNVAPVQEFLGASDPAKGAAQGAPKYMELKEFASVRKMTKALPQGRDTPPRQRGADDRYLPAPKAT